VRVVLDTNVVVSGVFFGGVPGRILSAWNRGQLGLVVSPSILAEYRRVGEILAGRHEGVDFEPFAALLAIYAEIIDAPEHIEPSVCIDPADDKFLACALATGVKVIVSGDAHLLDVTGWNGIQVLRPRTFADRHLPRE
jgi:uncharacterized protein